MESTEIFSHAKKQHDTAPNSASQEPVQMPTFSDDDRHHPATDSRSF